MYISRDPELVEADRLLPLIMGAHTTSGALKWTDDPTYLVNPWAHGRLVNLDDFPRLKVYFEENQRRLTDRHTVRKLSAKPIESGDPLGRRWHRTIDKVAPGLEKTPKLLLPDLKASIHPVLDEGTGYPHHNLYWVTSTGWDIEVLGGLLLSDIANLFVATYCVRMANGCLRFLAQYLRRIRVPDPKMIKAVDRRGLARAFDERDVERASQVARRLYGIS